jgi:hypothetical protein
MSYKLNVLHDNPVGFWLLDETSGSVASDSSAYGNHSTYNGTLNYNELPIVIDSQSATKIGTGLDISYSFNKDDYQNTSSTSFGTSETSDNDFSLECWIKSSIVNDSYKIALFGDLTNNIGIFWEYGKIVFSVQDTEISYLVPDKTSAYHVVCVYYNSSIYLYINSELVAYKVISVNSFSNSQLVLKSGPISDELNKFLIDCPAVYRYSLNSNQIKNHFYSAQGMPAIQIASPDDGELFKIQDTGVARQFEYSYPANKSWQSFNNLNLAYTEYDNSLSLLKNGSWAAAEAVIEDLITIPLGFDLNSSKIEWLATEGVEVYASVDNSVFIKCQNGFSIPKYRFGPNNFDLNRNLYLSIRFTSSNANKYLPKIYNLFVAFYNNKKIYAFNGGSTISHLPDSSKQSHISFGNYYSNILLRGHKNGLMCSNGSGFNLNTTREVQTVEFFYTPHITGIIEAGITDIAEGSTSIIDSSIITNPSGETMVSATLTDTTDIKSTLLYQEDSGVEYSWLLDGSVTSNNISKIYINGTDKTNETNILSSLIPGSIHHIIIVFDSPISGDIQFNYSDVGSVQATYQNIITYPSEFSGSKCLDHFNMWIGRYKVTASDSAMTLTEDSVSTLDNDWLVLQTA